MSIPVVCKHLEGGWWEKGIYYCNRCRVGFKSPPHEEQAAPQAPTPPDPNWNPYYYDPMQVPFVEAVQKPLDAAHLLASLAARQKALAELTEEAVGPAASVLDVLDKLKDLQRRAAGGREGCKPVWED